MPSKSFRENVLAGLVAAAIWWVGGRILEPLWKVIAVNGWPDVAEWFHELGWLAFLVGLALWLVNRRAMSQAPQPSIDVTTAYPLAIQSGAKTTLIEWRSKNVVGEGGRVDMVNGSIHLELWNQSGRARTANQRPVSFV